ncbi:xanthine dehydrogenase family protein molybdopterin-binding subunit [Caballeronia novacaledonica]|uniref:Xanthine dehydrogenase family protein molybdopterin-binding subunit n=1 Tax=Caballeronia novacaledonica TaxID=1544861 RepID=A0AA37II52_9BURK|nr:xanthine dehydrogenase family protein molybdopterin-binding subunit [Caballeronia novacaledonica]GJH29088.1 xanthine dehydrogenase family protein molybdopterin-binding subunit [Caballeronia novacaledonica]
MKQSTIGHETPQVTARDKVTGVALYGGDLKMPGMLHLKVLRSPHAHARIVRIDTEAARALPGVHLVLTGEDTPERLSGVMHKQHRILATGKVRFIGEEVVAVAAVDEETARDALDLIHVEYEELPAVLNPDHALMQGTIEVHQGTGNVAHEYHICQGDVDKAFETAAAVYEATYETHSQYPGYLEPMATVAWMGANDRLNVWTPSQMPFLQRMRFAEALDRPVSTIRIIQATTGGGFGGKTVEECNSLICAWVATKTRRPVRFLNSRLDDFQGARASVPERIWLKMGVSAEGIIVAKDVRIIAECGAYAGLAPEVLQVSVMRSDNMHRTLKNVRSHATLVYTNCPPRGAFRGFGGTQMTFCVSSHLSVLADKIGMDPIDLHTLNAVRSGDVTVHGFEVGSSGLSECLAQVRTAMNWDEKRSRPKGTGAKRRGIGMGAAIHVSGNRAMGNWDGSTIALKINPDGRVMLYTGEADIGQGANTMLAQICSHELSIPIDHVTVMPLDTDSSPYGLGSVASRVTVNGGMAAIKASKQALGKLLALAADKLGVPESELTFENGEVFSESPGTTGAERARISYGDLARMHIYRHGGEGLQVTSTYDPPTVMANLQQYGNVAPAYSFAAQGVEVEVDIETGKVSIVDTYISDDCGKALNPLAVHGQSCGAVTQGIGWTLYEQLHYQDCRLMNGNFADYTMPTADSIPEIRSGIVESNDPNGPYGAKGASETAIVPGAGAIANAVYDAVGVRINSLPITPEKVLAGLAELAKLKVIETEPEHAGI